MAIDGVAPRAKMNQQRSRRFRAAQEAQIKIEEEEKIRKEWEEANEKMPEKEKKQHFDSNCITPGTPFMDRLAICLRYYVMERMNTDPGWKNLKVILSDASVPGEGEHKVMDYIRRERNQPGYDPNTSHVLYGLDADLIMLALATHEPHFRILREDVFFKESANKGCFICGQTGHKANQCTGTKKEKVGEFDEKSAVLENKPYVFLHVPILREYLEMELKVPDIPFAWDLERAIDDWVFLCFFVGNDFLPHLPSLEIREGAIDKLIDIWKRNLPYFGGYLTDSGDIDLTRVQKLLEDLGQVEDDIFRKRREIEERKRESRKRRKEEEKRLKAMRAEQRAAKLPGAIAETMAAIPSFPVKMTKDEFGRTNREAIAARRAHVGGTSQEDVAAPVAVPSVNANKAAAAALKAQFGASTSTATTTTVAAGEPPPSSGVKRKAEDVVEEEEEVLEEGGGVVLPTINGSVPVPNGGSGEIPIDDDEEDKATPPIADTEDTEVLPDADAPAPEDAAEEEAVEEEDDDENVVEEVVVTDIPPVVAKPVKKKEDEDEEEEEPYDDVRLWEPGWKGRYYRNKFDVDEADEEFKRQVVTKYVEGFCWVLKYYYQGVQSWHWYFPYHYSPFASDFSFIGSLQSSIHFSLGTPFKPFEQLMGVLPAASSSHIPKVYAKLMTDESSPILDFYPEKFPIDLNGKKYAWQGVALLPFIDEGRLVGAMKGVVGPDGEGLTEEERRRNEMGVERVYLSGDLQPLFDELCGLLYGRQKDEDVEVSLDASKSDGLLGSLSPDPDVCIPG
ncbi:5'-3' exoribonuclease 2, partial [Quaeritorhiza haematococci]